MMLSRLNQEEQQKPETKHTSMLVQGGKSSKAVCEKCTGFYLQLCRLIHQIADSTYAKTVKKYKRKEVILQAVLAVAGLRLR